MNDASAVPRYARRKVLIATLRSVTYAAFVDLASPFSALAATPASAVPANSGATTGASLDQRFLARSSFLTGKTDLNTLTSQRTLAALQRVDGTFAARFAALDAALRDSGLADMAAFDDSSVGKDAALRATAVEIVSAWYLGHVGKGPEAELLAYHDALMYRPTAKLTTVPSYQLGGYGYWAKTPTA